MKCFIKLVWPLLLSALMTSAGMTAEDSKNVVLDYKLEYKTTKVEVSLIGWVEFSPPGNRPPAYYKVGTFEGMRADIVTADTQDGLVLLYAGKYNYDGHNIMRMTPDESPLGHSVQYAYRSYGSDEPNSTTVGSIEEHQSTAENLPVVSQYPEYPVIEPLDDFYIQPISHTNATYNTDGWRMIPETGPDLREKGNVSFTFSEPDNEEDAEKRAEEIPIAPPPPPEEPQPSAQDLAMVGASFRAARTNRDYVRYSSQFNLKLKLCEGDYVLKWRVEGKHKDDAGAPESYPQERNVTIDEDTALDEDGYYDLGWIDIAQELTPDYVYRLSTYQGGATQTFYIEPKDECGCADVGSGGVGFGSVKAWFNLGKDASGKSSGFIKLYSEDIGTDTHLPSALTVVRGDSTAARFEYDDNGALRQAISDRRIIDIVPLADPAEGYQLNYYDADDATGWDQGRFRTLDPSTTPTTVWTVKRLADSGGFKRLEITRTEGGANFVHVYGQDLTTPTTWSFSEAGGLRTTTRAETAAPGGDTYRTTTLSDGSYGVASVKRERIHTYAWGNEIIEETLDPAGTHPLTTTYEYYTSGVGQGQLWKTTDANGTVTENTYESVAIGPDVTSSRIASTTTTYLNGRVHTTTHGTLADLTSTPADEAHALITTTESLGGQVLRRSWQISHADAEDLDGDGVLYTTSRSIRTAASSAAWDDPRNEITLSRAANPATGRINVTVSPDGTATRTHHGLPDSNGIRIITTETGPANATGTGLLSSAGGTRNEVEIDARGRTVSRTTTDLASGLTTALELVTAWDTSNDELPTHISYLDGSEEVRTYSPCCGKLSTITRHGRTTSYTYDALGRQLTTTTDGLTTETRHDAADRVRETLVYPSASPSAAKLVSAATFDPAGRLTASTAPHGHGQTTTATHAETINATTGETTTVTTYPFDTDLAAGIVTEVRAADGSLLRVTGNATSPVSYDYSTGTLTDASTWGYGSSDRFSITVETKLDANGDPTAETTTTYQDALGRTIKTVHADDATARRFYDAAGRLTKQIDPDGVTQLYDYATGGFGEKTTMAIDLAATTGGTRNGAIDLAGGHDRVTVTTTSIADRDGTTVRRTKTEVWENGTAPTEVNLTDISVDGLKSWRTTRGTQTTSTITVIGAGGTRTETTTNPDNTEIVRTHDNGRLQSEVFKDSAGVTVATTTYQYDDYGRLEATTRTGVGTTSYTYYDDGQIETVTTPDPGAGAQTTTYTYNKRGWLASVTQPGWPRCWW